MDKWEGSQLNTAKEILAFELTKLVHGEEEAAKAQASARALFSSGSAADMPETNLTEADLRDGRIDVMGILVAAGLCKSRSEARRAVEQGGVTVNGEKITDLKTDYAPEDIQKEEFIIRRGKKNYRKITFK
jgi:tyrosyl-tRNA synthetase